MRLTERDGDKVWFAHGRPCGYLCPREFCDNVYECDKVRDRTCPYLRLLDKLAAFEDAEEQGLLVQLPCKVGDTVFYIIGSAVYKAKAFAFRINESCIRVYCERNFMGLIGFDGIFGQTVFLSYEEAAAALETTK